MLKKGNAGASTTQPPEKRRSLCIDLYIYEHNAYSERFLPCMHVICGLTPVSPVSSLC